MGCVEKADADRGEAETREVGVDRAGGRCGGDDRDDGRGSTRGSRRRSG